MNSMRLTGWASQPLVVAAALAVLAAAPASAQGTKEEQDACAPDAFKFCASVIPDIPRVTSCMEAHRSQLSPRCQAQFTQNETDAAKPQEAAEHHRKASHTKVARRHDRVRVVREVGLPPPPPVVVEQDGGNTVVAAPPPPPPEAPNFAIARVGPLTEYTPARPYYCPEAEPLINFYATPHPYVHDPRCAAYDPYYASAGDDEDWTTEDYRGARCKATYRSPEQCGIEAPFNR